MIMTEYHSFADLVKIVHFEILFYFGNCFPLYYNQVVKNFLQELRFFVTKYALYCLFHRPHRFSQSPEPLIEQKNRFGHLKICHDFYLNIIRFIYIYNIKKKTEKKVQQLFLFFFNKKRVKLYFFNTSILVKLRFIYVKQIAKYL